MGGMTEEQGRGCGAVLWPLSLVVTLAVLWALLWVGLVVWSVWQRHQTGYVGLVISDQQSASDGWRVAGTRPGSPAAVLGVETGWRLVAVDRRPVPPLAYHGVDDLASRAELARWRFWHRWLTSRVRPGNKVRLSFRTGSGRAILSTQAVSTPLSEWMRSGLLSAVVGVLFAILGLVLVVRRPDNVPARRLLVYGLFFQAFLSCQSAIQLPRTLVLSHVEWFLSFGLGDLFFNLSSAAMLNFVVAFVWPDWKGRPRMALVLYGLALVASGAYTFRWAGRIFLFFAPALYAAGMALLFVQFRRETRVLRRKQLKWLLWGGGIPVATLVVVYGLAVLPWFDIVYSSSVDIMTLSTLMFPVAVLMAVQSDRLFDIDPIVRRSLLAALVLPILILAYSQIVGFLGGVLASWANPGFLLVVILVVLLMLPGQVRVEELLDRVLGRNRFAGARRLQTLAGRLAQMDEAEDVVQATLQDVAEALGLVCCCLFVADPLDQPGERLCHPTSLGEWTQAPRPIPWQFLESLETGVLLVENQPDLVLPEGMGKPTPVALVVLVAGARRLGLLAAGPTEHQGGWSHETVQALEAAAGAAAAALDRIQHRRLLDRVRSMQAQIVHTGRLAALGTLAAGLAHELNTPLGYIKANAQLVARKLADHPDLAALVQDMEQGADQMHEVVSNLRSFASLDHPDLVMTDINECVRQTIKMLARVARGDVHIDTDLADLPLVPARPVQINQLVLNLVSNALDASPSGGHVSVRTRAHSAFVEIEVTDQGPGLPKDVLERVFDPFFTTKPPGKGMGLGLSITRSIVDAHGGKITLENRQAGGAVARVLLPLAGALEQERDNDHDAQEVS